MVNKAILIGRMGKDPEVRTTDAGVKVATVSLATNSYYKDKEGNRQESTEWHRVIFWRGLAEVVEKYCKKGNLIFVEGPMKIRSWEDNGVKKYVTEVVAKEMKMLSVKKNDIPAPSSDDYVEEATVVNDDSGDDETDDLPF